MFDERRITIINPRDNIRKYGKNDLTTIMQIWLDTHIKTHNFIPKEYWINNYEVVMKILPRAEVYVYEDIALRQILGFIGLTGDYIAGIFIKEAFQSNGIGKQLLDYVKVIKTNLSLRVYQKNVRAIAFYQREQFFIKSESMDHSTNEKEYVMNWNK